MDNDKRVQAMLMELSAQRQAALDRCVNLMGDLAEAKARVAELEAKYEPKPEKTAD